MFSCIQQRNEQLSFGESLSSSDSRESSPSPPLPPRQKQPPSLKRLDAWIGYLLKEGCLNCFSSTKFEKNEQNGGTETSVIRFCLADLRISYCRISFRQHFELNYSAIVKILFAAASIRFALSFRLTRNLRSLLKWRKGRKSSLAKLNTL